WMALSPVRTVSAIGSTWIPRLILLSAWAWSLPSRKIQRAKLLPVIHQIRTGSARFAQPIEFFELCVGFSARRMFHRHGRVVVQAKLHHGEVAISRELRLQQKYLHRMVPVHPLPRRLQVSDRAVAADEQLFDLRQRFSFHDFLI